jgi:hypothetical protein
MKPERGAFFALGTSIGAAMTGSYPDSWATYVVIGLIAFIVFLIIDVNRETRDEDPNS